MRRAVISFYALGAVRRAVISFYALGAKGSDFILRTWCEGQLFHFTHLVRRAVISFYALGAKSNDYPTGWTTRGSIPDIYILPDVDEICSLLGYNTV